jgi:hypothetical protein
MSEAIGEIVVAVAAGPGYPRAACWGSGPRCRAAAAGWLRMRFGRLGLHRRRRRHDCRGLRGPPRAVARAATAVLREGAALASGPLPCRRVAEIIGRLGPGGGGLNSGLAEPLALRHRRRWLTTSCTAMGAFRRRRHRPPQQQQRQQMQHERADHPRQRTLSRPSTGTDAPTARLRGIRDTRRGALNSAGSRRPSSGGPVMSTPPSVTPRRERATRLRRAI